MYIQHQLCAKHVQQDDFHFIIYHQFEREGYFLKTKEMIVRNPSFSKQKIKFLTII